MRMSSRATVSAALHFAFVLQFQFARDGGQGGVDVADARDNGLSALRKARRSALEITFSSAEMGRRWLTPERLSIFCLREPKGHPFNHFADVPGNVQFKPVTQSPGFLRGDRDAFFESRRVVCANLRADAVFEWRDDLAARCVVFRVGGEDQRHIERQADRIALNLNVAFLHDVEQLPTWNFTGQIGQFIYGEDAAVGAGQQSVMDGEFAASLSAASGFDGINVADHVGDGDVGVASFST